MTNGTIFTSLAEIKSFEPCADGWGRIVRARKAATERFDVEERFPLVSCLDSNSVADMFWLLRKLYVPAYAAFCAEAARGFADSVAHLRGVTYAADAADAAADATYADAADARISQNARNKQILRDAILRWEAASPSRRLINL